MPDGPWSLRPELFKMFVDSTVFFVFSYQDAAPRLLCGPTIWTHGYFLLLDVLPMSYA
jgi:hypothetical protein